MSIAVGTKVEFDMYPVFNTETRESLSDGERGTMLATGLAARQAGDWLAHGAVGTVREVFGEGDQQAALVVWAGHEDQPVPAAVRLLRTFVERSTPAPVVPQPSQRYVVDLLVNTDSLALVDLDAVRSTWETVREEGEERTLTHGDVVRVVEPGTVNIIMERLVQQTGGVVVVNERNNEIIPIATVMLTQEA